MDRLETMDKLKTLGDALAAFAVEPARKKAAPFYTTAFLNWFGCAVAGSQVETLERAAAFYHEDAPSSLKPLVGRTERLSSSVSVGLDCLSSSTLAYDDIHFSTTLHPTGPVAAAILGLSRVQPVSGADAIHALRVGMEVECRVATVIFNEGTGASRGWYATGITGGIGAAAAVGRLLGFDQERMKTALGLAAAKASGTRGTHAAMSGYWPPAVAAESGYTAARLTEAGFTCKIDALTGANGLISLMAPWPDVEAGLQGLGIKYICEETACKPYPFGFIAHAVIKNCLDLREKLQRENRRLKKLDILVSPTSAALGSNSTPKTVFDAIVSLRYIAAGVLVEPDFAFTPVCENFTISPKIAEMMGYITINADEMLRDEQAKCLATFEDGSQCKIYCGKAPGSPGNLPTEEEIWMKFLRLVSSVCGQEKAGVLLDMLSGLENLQDISMLLEGCWSLPQNNGG